MFQTRFRPRDSIISKQVCTKNTSITSAIASDGSLTQTSLPVLECFGEVVCFDDVGSIKVGDCPGQLEDAVESASGKMELFHSGAE